MFPYMETIALFRVAVSTFELWLTLRQRKNSLVKKMRPELDGLVPEEKFISAQDYARDKIDFGIINQVFDIIINLLMYFTYFMARTWDYSLRIMVAVRPNLGPENDIIRTIIFCTIFSLIGKVLGTPFSLYYNFVLQEKYGFNRMTAAQYIKDSVLGAVMTAVIGIPVLIGIWYTIDLAGPRLWLFFWLFIVVLTLFLQLIYPTIIAPLFNKFTPLADGKLKEGINALASEMKFPLSRLYVMDGSKRSSHSNAYFYGLFDKRIVIYDTLLEQNKNHEERVLGVLCHELGHWYLNHIKKLMAISLIHMLALSWMFGETTHNVDLFKSFGFSDMPYIIGLQLFSELYSPAECVIGLAMNWISRKYEYEADAFAKGMNHGTELAEALVGLHVENLGEMNPDPLYSAYHNSHPTLVERLHALDIRPKMDIANGEEAAKVPVNTEDKKEQ